MNPLLKNILVAVAIVAIAFLGYRFFFSGDAKPAGLKFEGAQNETGGQAGRDFLVALADLKNINLDLSSGIFNDRAFSSLKDMSVSLPSEPRGRPNPFRAIGNNIKVSSPTTTETGGSLNDKLNW